MVGQRYWGTRIAAALDGAGEDIAARFAGEREYPGLLLRPPRGRLLLLRAGYRPGATTPRGRLFDAWWTLLRRRVPRAAAGFYWLGTDVQDTLREARAGTVAGGLARARRDLHLADAAWLADELREVGIEAAHVPVPQPYPVPPVVPPLPERFRVLTYLPGDRFAFYGGDVVLEAARRLPDVGFDVVGRTGEAAAGAPPNVTFHGWVPAMAPLYAAATVVVRIPRHDGMGATVIEALLHARHVVYTHEVPHVTTLRPVDADGLTAALAALRDAQDAGTLGPNLAGRAFAIATYDEAAMARRLAEFVRSHA